MSGSILNRLRNKNNRTRLTALNTSSVSKKGYEERKLTKNSLSKKSNLFSFRVKDTNDFSHGPEARLNQPQQYEATIN